MASGTAMRANMENEKNWQIIVSYGPLRKNPKAGDWTKELNLISWNHGGPRLDIRMWSPHHKEIGKGISLSWGEAYQLRDLLNTILGKPGHEQKTQEAAAAPEDYAE